MDFTRQKLSSLKNLPHQATGTVLGLILDLSSVEVSIPEPQTEEIACSRRNNKRDIWLWDDSLAAIRLSVVWSAENFQFVENFLPTIGSVLLARNVQVLHVGSSKILLRTTENSQFQMDPKNDWKQETDSLKRWFLGAGGLNWTPLSPLPCWMSLEEAVKRSEEHFHRTQGGNHEEVLLSEYVVRAEFEGIHANWLNVFCHECKSRLCVSKENTKKTNFVAFATEIFISKDQADVLKTSPKHLYCEKCDKWTNRPMLVYKGRIGDFSLCHLKVTLTQDALESVTSKSESEIWTMIHKDFTALTGQGEENDESQEIVNIFRDIRRKNFTLRIQAWAYFGTLAVRVAGARTLETVVYERFMNDKLQLSGV